MQRLYLLFTLCLLVALTAGAETVTLSWSGNGGTSDASTSLTTSNIFTNGSGGYYNGDVEAATATAVTYVYAAQSNYGLKFSSSKKSGVLTLSFSDDLKPTKITINAARYSDSEQSLSVSVNGGSANALTLTSSFADYEISMDGSTTLESLSVSASKRAYLKSIVITYSGGATVETVATPTFSPAGGTYTGAQSVTIGCATAGATIHYTTDGSTPTTSSSVYSDAINVTSSCTIKAIAVKSGMNNSEVASATYTIEQSGSGGNEGKYVLVTDAGTLKAGDKLIIANSATVGSAYAIANTEKPNNRPATAITITSDLAIDPTSSTEIYELVGSSGSWSFKAISDASHYKSQYLDASGDDEKNNYLTYTTSISQSSQASISISNGEATVIFGATRGYLRYNPNNNSPLFNCYASTSSVSALPSIYRLVEEQPEPELEVVTGIGGFKQVTVGSTVRLYLPDSYNARVLHVTSNSDGTTDAYVRDDRGGAMLMQGISPNRPMTYGQHLAGYINGTFSTNADGMPLFVPDDGLTNTAFLVIADPVTEAEVNPKEIAAAEIGDNLADWVAVTDIETATSGIALQNALGTAGYTAPYSGSIVDVSAIAAASSKLYPITHNEVPIITYVIDSEKNFVSPPSNITGTAVRVKRSLTAGQWAPLTLPFDYDAFEGEVMEFSSLAPGDPVQGSVSGQWFPAGNMYFTASSTMQAGVPYLVKPNDNYSEFVAEGVTLSKTAATAVTYTVNGRKAPARAAAIDAADEYSYVGVYSPTTLPDDASYKILTADGNIVWASDITDRTVPGTTAYFTSPADQGLRVVLGNEGSAGVLTGIADITIAQGQQAPTGIYNIMGVKMPDDWQQLPPGFYIVNGVKTIKR